WSSDVCSSDLPLWPVVALAADVREVLRACVDTESLSEGIGVPAARRCAGYNYNWPGPDLGSGTAGSGRRDRPAAATVTDDNGPPSPFIPRCLSERGPLLLGRVRLD